MRLSLIGMAFPVVRRRASSSAHFSPVSASQGRQWRTPTMKDMLSIQGAIERYEKGGDIGDRKLQESAFWDDAIMIGPMGKRPFKQALVGGGPPPSPGGPPGAGGPQIGRAHV